MRYAAIVLCCIAGIGQAWAESCPGNPDAIGTSRTVVVDAATLPVIGTMHYPTSVPLEDHEVLLTFDDGPRPPYTTKILEALAAECAKATFFMVGFMARANPDVVKRVYNDGHNIGSHSQNHPINFGWLGPPGIAREVNDGFATLAAAAGDARAIAPFFRAPGLAQNRWLNLHLATRGTSLWSTDEHGWDWTGISASEIVRRAMLLIEAKGRGVVLLHDTQPATALAIPALLKVLKARGYRIVHAAAPGERLKSVPQPTAPTLVASQGWPRVLPVNTSDKAPTERVVPTLADGSGLLPPTAAPISVNASMKPVTPDRKQVEPVAHDPDITNTVTKRLLVTWVAHRRHRPQQPMRQTAFRQTAFSGLEVATQH